MFIQENVPLNTHSTMRLGGNAAYLADITNREELKQAVAWARERNLPLVMIGGGSNIIWADKGFPGLVMVNKITGITEQNMGDQWYLTAGAGDSWDAFVAHSVERGLTGIEFLSLIPGTVGGTPVQNVGAYGQEVASTIMTIEAYDLKSDQFVTLRGSGCGFSYRNSRFKGADRGRFLITSVTFSLTKGNPQPPFYGTVEHYCQEHGIQELTPATGREAVVAIRRAKLPDPATVANNGSFFGNPIVDNDRYFELENQFPGIVHWQTEDGRVKLSAAWLIEQAGFKDYHDKETGMATWPTQCLVLVNEHATSTSQLLAFRQKIIDTIKTKFGVVLEQEPEFMGQL
jgi:UDP-N-acetylmuramate dehydrogenase